MFKHFKNVLAKRDPLCEAGRAGDSRAFVRLFVASELMLLALALPDAVAPAALSEDEFIDLVERAAQEMSEQTEIQPFTYTEGSAVVLPAFTSDKATDAFAMHYAREVGRVVPFQVLTMSGGAVASCLSQDMRVTLNPKDPSEYPLSDKDLAALLVENRPVS